MKFVILYSGKSSKTGKELLAKFSTVATKAFRKRTNKRFRADLVLRWGSTEAFPRLTSRVEINSLEATVNASNKLVMMKKLVEAGIPTPQVTFNVNSDLSTFKDGEGKFYVRGANQEVRYTDTVRPNDLYVSKPLVNKRREYRVHVFNGKVIGIYEKVPNQEGVRLYKSHNCDFRSVNPENCRVSLADQEMCIRAVNALGLTFGGVDLMRDKDQNCFVSEINSAPALNTPNIERYFNKIMEFYRENILSV
jgi:glutathione synthase/RimK-type ligase-like ATP-grasp enzyme